MLGGAQPGMGNCALIAAYADDEWALPVMERVSCDILVIGAGPAGSTAARVAAREGARVLLVERKARVGVPEQCAGYVSQAIRRHVDLPPWCVVQAVGRLRTFLPDGSVQEAEMPGYLLDRAALDQSLALQAVHAGARLLAHTVARCRSGQAAKGNVREAHESPLQGGEGPEVVVARHASQPRGWSGGGPGGPGADLLREMGLVRSQEGREIAVDARVVIGADGPRSAVARWLGIPPGPVARGVQYEVALGRGLEAAEVFFRPAFRGGYAWLFPAGKVARLGAAFDEDCEEGEPALRQLMGELEEEGRVLDSVLSYTSGPVPVGGPGTARRGNVLLVGDAAGHTHPVTGAGILNAIIAGEMAGRAAARAVLDRDEAVLGEYEEELRLVLDPALERAKEKRRQLNETWDLSPAGLSSAIKRSWIAFEEYYG